jgi:hypothetical protein
MAFRGCGQKNARGLAIATLARIKPGLTHFRISPQFAAKLRAAGDGPPTAEGAKWILSRGGRFYSSRSLAVA